MSDFRSDGAAAVEWVARYLEGVRERPVLAAVEPGQVRSALPASPPEQGEPFAAVLRDLDEMLLPGITHWNHPRFFAYFAISGSEPGILAELLAAALNVNAMLWRTSPAATELEELALDWLRQLLGLPEGPARPHRGHRLHLDAGRARRGSRAASGRRRALLRARALLRGQGGAAARAAAAQGGRGRRVPAATGRARGDARRRRGGRRHGRHDVDHLRRPRARDRRSLRGGGRVAPRRRRLRGLRGRLPRAPLGARRAASAPTRSSSTRTSGSSRPSTAPASSREGRTCSASAFSLVPEYLRTSEDGRDEPDGLRTGARPPLPGAQALGGPALLRPGGPGGAHPRARAARAAASAPGSRKPRGGRSSPRTRSPSSASGARAPTRKTRRCSNA